MPMATEAEKVAPLVGTKENPAREPSKKPATGKGSMGDIAFKDAVLIVVIAWIVIFFLAYTLRHHNV